MAQKTLPVLLAALALLAGPDVATAAAREPAVARPVLRAGDGVDAVGTAFFISIEAGLGVAAITTAHNFDLGRVVEADQVEFRLGHSKRSVARSLGFLAPPGLPFNAPGGSLRGDFVVYALAAPPSGVRVLEPERRREPTPGQRVQILGIPPRGPHDDDDVFGRIAVATPTRIEIDLDVPYELHGWGGAPVVSGDTGHVIGLVQAHWPRGATARVGVGPIAGALAALEKPLSGGDGSPFAAFRSEIAARPAPVATPGNGRPERAARAAPPPPSKPYVRQAPTDETQIHLAVEYPPDGAEIADSLCGAFVAGRALAHQGELRHFDVVFVLDTSRSTIDPTGADINGNGVIGKPRLGRIGSIFDVGSTDPGDNILSAEVAAARQLLRSLDPRSTRVAIVTFAGEPPGSGGVVFTSSPRRPAVTVEPLTTDYSSIERALSDIARREPEGSTHMAAGVDQATIELLGLRGAMSEPNPRSEKIVFFFTDGQPTLPYGPEALADNVRAVLRAANRASRGQIRIHSFAIGPEALEGPVATVEMAARTDGFFTPVRHPGDLVDVVEGVNFANLEDVVVMNTTTGESASPFRATADGSWGGFLKLEEGVNQIEVSATTDDGMRASRTLTVKFVPQAAEVPLPRELVVQRNRLLEDCLREIKRVRMAAEKEHAEQVRRELMVEIERERAQARDRAEEQRKQLELEVGKDEID